MRVGVWSDYLWVDDEAHTVYGSAGSICVAEGVDFQEALDILGAGPASPESEAADEDSPGVGRVSGLDLLDAAPRPACVVIQGAGLALATPDAVVALSKKGKSAAVSWNQEGLVIFTCARKKRVLACVDLLDCVETDLPRVLRSLLKHVHAVSPVAVGMAMVETFVGAAVTPVPAVTQPTTWFPMVRPPLSLQASREELIGLGYPSRELVAASQEADSSALRNLAEWSSREAIASAGLRDDPAIKKVLSAFGSDNRSRPTPGVVLLRQQANAGSLAAAVAYSNHGDSAEWRRLSHWGPKFWAMEALAYTSCDDPLTAGLGATYCAEMCVGKDAGVELLAEALRLLEE